MVIDKSFSVEVFAIWKSVDLSRKIPLCYCFQLSLVCILFQLAQNWSSNCKQSSETLVASSIVGACAA
jgi:hypothetical protein